MKIKFTELEPGVRGSANGMYLRGTKDYDGSDYEKFYFDKSRDGDETPLHKVAKTLQAGDMVDLKFDSSKYKNLESINKLDGGSDSGSQGKGSSKGSGGSGGGSAKSKGNYRDPDHTDRSSAMYLAWDIVERMEGITGEKKVAAPKSASVMAQFEDLAKRLENFLHTGKFPNGKVEEEAPAPSDADAPADGEQDDIPF